MKGLLDEAAGGDAQRQASPSAPPPAVDVKSPTDVRAQTPTKPPKAKDCDVAHESAGEEEKSKTDPAAPGQTPPSVRKSRKAPFPEMEI